MNTMLRCLLKFNNRYYLIYQIIVEKKQVLVKILSIEAWQEQTGINFSEIHVSYFFDGGYHQSFKKLQSKNDPNEIFIHGYSDHTDYKCIPGNKKEVKGKSIYNLFVGNVKPIDELARPVYFPTLAFNYPINEKLLRAFAINKKEINYDARADILIDIDILQNPSTINVEGFVCNKNYVISNSKGIKQLKNDACQIGLYLNIF